MSSFNQIHKKIIMNTGGTASINDQKELNVFLDRAKEDFGKIANYINNIAYPIFKLGTNNTDWVFDIAEDGIAATTLQTFPVEHGGNAHGPDCYWVSDGTTNGGRPRTIKETFDCLLAMFTEQKVIVQEQEVDLGGIQQSIICNQRDLQQLKKDAFGCNYAFGCDGEKELTWSLTDHIYKILSVFTGFDPNTLKDSLGITGCPEPAGYPGLIIEVNSSDINWDSCLNPSNICPMNPNDVWGQNKSLRTELEEAYGLLGFNWSSDGDYANVLDFEGNPLVFGSPFNEQGQLGRSIRELLAICMSEIPKKADLAFKSIVLSSDGGTLLDPGPVPADEDRGFVANSSGDILRLIAGDNIELDVLSANRQIKISATGGAGGVGPAGPAGPAGADGQSIDFSTQYDGPHDIQEGRNVNNQIFVAMTVDSGLSYVGGEYITIQSDANPEYVQVGIVLDYVDNGDGTGSLTYDHVTATGGGPGYSGNEIWNINISGAPGEAGNDGAEGPAGPQGPAGADGAQGPAGPAGADGAQGPAGADGIDGADGAQGPAGPAGAQGPQGPAGGPNNSITALAGQNIEKYECVQVNLFDDPSGMTVVYKFNGAGFFDGLSQEDPEGIGNFSYGFGLGVAADSANQGDQVEIITYGPTPCRSQSDGLPWEFGSPLVFHACSDNNGALWGVSKRLAQNVGGFEQKAGSAVSDEHRGSFLGFFMDEWDSSEQGDTKTVKLKQIFVRPA